MIKSFGISRPGLVRTVNEDCIFCSDASFFILADGMGGYEGGRIASTLAVKTVKDYMENLSDSAYSEDALRDAILFSNRVLLRRKFGEPCLEQMGTTLIVCAFYQDKMYWAHVGDSRLYIEQNGELSQITRDHSLVRELYEAGEISKEEMRNHPRKNEITRAVGVASSLSVDTGTISFENSALILLCTDGISTPLGDETIHRILSETGETGEALSISVEQLTDTVYKNGARDNMSAILISYVPDETSSKTVGTDECHD